MQATRDNDFLSQLEKMSEAVFSDHKAKRQKGRDQVLKNINYFKTSQNLRRSEKEKYSEFNFLAYAVHEFVQNNQFIFEINPKKVEEIPEKGKERFDGTHKFPKEDSKEPVYFVMMPHLVGGKQDLNEQINLIFNESFGTNKTESKEIAKTRMHLFVGMNYCHSINHLENKKKKEILAKTTHHENQPNLSLHAFRWNPLWKYSDSEIKDKISQKTVKRLFRLLQEIDDSKASKIYKEVMKEKVVPYQYIREEIRDGKHLNQLFKEFRKRDIQRLCCLATVDNDAKKLRTDEIGLFSYYDKLLKDHKNLKVASTGYVMRDPKNDFVEIASRLNLVGRIALAKAIPNAVYYPEPNMIIKVPKGKEIPLEISFVRSKENKGKSLESIGLLENMHLMKGKVVSSLIFGSRGAIQTAVSPNVDITDKNLGEIDIIEFLNSKNIKSLRDFSQSILNPLNGFAKNVGRTYPTGAGSGKPTSLISSVFTSLDLIDYKKVIQDLSLEAWRSIMCAILASYETEDKNTREKIIETKVQRMVKKNKIDKADKNRVSRLIKSKCKILLDTKNQMLEIKTKDGAHFFDGYDFSIILQGAIYIHEAIIEELEKMIKEGY